MHLNQSLDEILSLVCLQFSLFSLSIIISILFLKLTFKKEEKLFLKAFIPNIIFFAFTYILYQVAIKKGVNIAVFSPNKNTEFMAILISLTIVLIIISLIEIFIFKLFFNADLYKTYYKLLYILNTITYSIILCSFCPKPYINKEIINYNRYLYTPNKTTLKLFDNTIIEIGVACSSENNYNTNQNDSIYNFKIPIKQTGSDRMLYTFKLLDVTLKDGSTAEDLNCKIISLKKLDRIIKIVFVQRNPNQNIGWKNPIATDTILFTKTKTEIRKSGYYEDCDCIEN